MLAICSRESCRRCKPPNSMYTGFARIGRRRCRQDSFNTGCEQPATTTTPCGVSRTEISHVPPECELLRNQRNQTNMRRDGDRFVHRCYLRVAPGYPSLRLRAFPTAQIAHLRWKFWPGIRDQKAIGGRGSREIGGFWHKQRNVRVAREDITQARSMVSVRMGHHHIQV